MAEVDYGYGENDYGYGDGKPDDGDYGYGDAKPDEPADYGYGDAKSDDDPYGYGNAQPDNTDYGYGDSEPAPPKTRRPKRRCSVTKYSLEESGQKAGTPEAEMVQQLHAAEMLQHFRNGGSGAPPPAAPDSGYTTDGKSSETVATTLSTDSSDEGANTNSPEMAPLPKTEKKKAKGGLARFRKRLSIF